MILSVEHQYLAKSSFSTMSKGKGTVAAVPFPFVTPSPNACCKIKLVCFAHFEHDFATAYDT